MDNLLLLCSVMMMQNGVSSRTVQLMLLDPVVDGSTKGILNECAMEMMFSQSILGLF